jgi:hypothetical protein
MRPEKLKNIQRDFFLNNFDKKVAAAEVVASKKNEPLGPHNVHH